MRVQSSSHRTALVLSAIIAVALLVELAFGPVIHPKAVRAGDNTWTQVGPWGGTVNSVVFSPAYGTDHTAFAGTHGGGIFVSSDGGASWRSTNAGLPFTPILTLAISPDFDADRTLFAGTAEWGLFKSTDAGMTWIACNSGLPDMRVQAIAVSPDYAQDGTIFVGTGSMPSNGLPPGGVFRSNDRGQTWVPRNDGIMGGRKVRALALSPNFANDQTVYASIETSAPPPQEAGVFRSTNAGTRWYPINSGLPARAIVTSLAVSPDFEHDQVIYAGTYGSGVFRSSSRGTTWFRASAGLDHPMAVLVQALAISPDHAKDGTIYVGTYEAGVYRSTNSAERWSLSGLFRENVRALAISPNYDADGSVFAASSSGLSRTGDKGNSWYGASEGLAGYDIGSMAFSPSYAQDGTIVAARGEGPAAIMKTNNAGTTWTHGDSGLEANYVRALSISPDFVSDRQLLCGTDLGIFKSGDAAGSWRSVTHGLGVLDIQTVAISASDQLFGSTTQSVYRSTDGGATWQTSGPGPGSGEIRCLAVSPNFQTDGLVFIGTHYVPPVGTTGGIWVSANRGASWQPAKAGIPNYPYVNAIVFSPGFASDRTMFAGLSHPGRSGGVFKSTDGGATWQAMNSGIAFDPEVGPEVLALAVSPDYTTDRTVYAGTNGFGVFRSRDGGTSWQRLGDDLYNPFISALHAPSGAFPAILAGTREGSIWHYRSVPPTPTPTNTSTATHTPTTTATPTTTTTPTTRIYRLYLPIVTKS